MAVSPLNPRTSAFENVHQLVEIDLAGVAAGGLEECAMGGAKVHALLSGFAVEESEGEAAGEPVAAAHTVFDLQVLVPATFVKFSFRVEDRRPVVDQAALDLSKCRADDFDMRISLHDLLDHPFVGGGVQG